MLGRSRVSAIAHCLGLGGEGVRRGPLVACAPGDRSPTLPAPAKVVAKVMAKVMAKLMAKLMGASR